MNIKGYVTECDFTGKQYPKPVIGVHGICRGATGRWCCVMHTGPEFAATLETVTFAAACAAIAANEGDYVDFVGFGELDDSDVSAPPLAT